jgi:cytochrome c biogenesis protein CcmG/thiol:disulfide interchange protein DsbE
VSGRRWLAPALALLSIAVVSASSACSASTGSADDDTPAPFAGCGALTAAPPSAAPSSAALAPSSVASPATTLPDLRLPCFTGGEQIALRELRGPAVINMWASWCGPCRDELPVMQRLADRADGRLTVLGVDTGDSREAGASFAAAAGVTMPTLYDADKKLLNAVARISLPVTVFVDSAGRSYVHPLPLDAQSLATQVRTHTGVTVTP